MNQCESNHSRILSLACIHFFLYLPLMKNTITKRAPRHPYRTRSKSRTMGDQEETQEQRKADMSALNEQMASMMEVMLGMRQLMEKNVATTAAVSSDAEADPTLPATVHHPLPNTVGRERSTLGHISNPHLGYNWVAYPYGLPPNYTPPIMRDDAGHVPSPILEGEPPRQPDEVHEDHREYAQGDVDFYPPVPVEGPAPNTLPQHNLTAQPIFLSTEGPPPARWRDLAAQVAPPMVEREMITMMVYTLSVFYYEKLVGYMPSSFVDLVFAGERIEVGLKRGKFDYYAQHHPSFSARAVNSSNSALVQPRAPAPIQREAPQAPAPTTTRPAGNAHFGAVSNVMRNFPPRPILEFTLIPMTYEDLLPSLIANQMAVVSPWKIYQTPFPKWYDPDATCAYHGKTPGHSIEQCLALKYKVQHLIDAGWLTFQEDWPNVKTNPLANHGGGAVNAVESGRPRRSKPLKDVTTPRRFIYEALQKGGVIPHVGHREDSCLMHPVELHNMETFNDEGREEQHICMQSTDERCFGRPKPLVVYFTKDAVPQKPRYPLVVKPIPFPYRNSHAVPWRYAPPSERKEEATDISSLSAKVTNITGLNDVTHSGRVFAPPDLPTQSANVKGKAKMVEEQDDKMTLTPNEDIPVKGLPEKRDGCGKKEVSLEEAGEFLRIIQQSEFKLNKIPARVSLLELLMSSEPHRALLVKVLNEAHVAQDISVEGFRGLINNITANNYLAFAEEEIPAEGRGHNRALHISVKCIDHVMAKVLIDNNSSLNVMPKSTLEKLPFNASHLKPSSMVVRAFDGTRREVRGEIDLPVQIGPHTYQVTFQIMDTNPAYNCLLGCPWIHSVGVVPFTLHQKLKFVVEGHLVIVLGEEDILVSCSSSMPYVEAMEESLETAFQSFEVVSIASVDSFSGQPCLSDTTMMVARVMLRNGYEPGMGLGKNNGGRTSLISTRGNRGKFGLGYKPTQADIRKSVAGRKSGSQGSQLGQKVEEGPPCHISRSFISAGLGHEGQVITICEYDSSSGSDLVRPCPPGFRIGNWRVEERPDIYATGIISDDESLEGTNTWDPTIDFKQEIDQTEGEEDEDVGLPPELEKIVAHEDQEMRPHQEETALVDLGIGTCALAVQATIDSNVKLLKVYGDSALVIHQLRGEWKTRDPKLIPYQAYIKELAGSFDEISFHHVPREENQMADALATLESMFQLTTHEDLPYIEFWCRGRPAHCCQVEEERDGKPWYFDIKRYVESKGYPPEASDHEKRTLRRLTVGFFMSGSILYKRNHDMTLL
ncbi:Ribonuclease HI [Glycine soja]